MSEIIPQPNWWLATAQKHAEADAECVTRNSAAWVCACGACRAARAANFVPSSPTSKFSVAFRGTGHQAQCPPNPSFPEGIDLETPGNPAFTCTVALPYPAPEVGVHVVRCSECSMSAAISAAGRPDDPRSVRLPCKKASGVL